MLPYSLTNIVTVMSSKCDYEWEHTFSAISRQDLVTFRVDETLMDGRQSNDNC